VYFFSYPGVGSGRGRPVTTRFMPRPSEAYYLQPTVSDEYMRHLHPHDSAISRSQLRPANYGGVTYWHRNEFGRRQSTLLMGNAYLTTGMVGYGHFTPTTPTRLKSARIASYA